MIIKKFSKKIGRILKQVKVNYKINEEQKKGKW